MKAGFLFSIFAIVVSIIGCKDQKKKEHIDQVIGTGKMPNLAGDNAGNFHIVYGSGDSILYISSTDKGESFSDPSLVAILPGLSAASMRGPQIASTKKNGIVIIACNKSGNIYSYIKNISGNWSQPVKVNDVDTVAKEQFMALSADGDKTFAVWLDLRGNKRNKIAGSGSTDGGKTWSKNVLVYASPDSSVCECCKPSVAVRGANVYVMFRNWLHGNRDLHLIQSENGGKSFGETKRLGGNSWALNGCPMDGGGLVINNNGVPETVWRRRDSIYGCEPGQTETAIGTGRGCTLASVNNKNVYAWTENGDVVIRKPQGMKINLGKGQLPLIKRINDEHVLCVWENDRQIHAATVSL
jgi:hypothetical protein